MFDGDKDFFELSSQEKIQYWKTHGETGVERFLVVLQLFLDSPQKGHLAFEVYEVTGLTIVATFDILEKMAKAGWLEEKREDIMFLELGSHNKDVSSTQKKRPRILYWLSKNGDHGGRKLLHDRKRSLEALEDTGGMMPIPA